MIYEFAATQDLHGWGKPWAPGENVNLIGAIRGMNINQLQMPASGERGAQEILAEIINPPGKGG